MMLTLSKSFLQFKLQASDRQKYPRARALFGMIFIGT
jgi:hypothetical protein